MSQPTPQNIHDSNESTAQRKLCPFIKRTFQPSVILTCDVQDATGILENTAIIESPSPIYSEEFRVCLKEGCMAYHLDAKGNERCLRCNKP